MAPPVRWLLPLHQDTADELFRTVLSWKRVRRQSRDDDPARLIAGHCGGLKFVATDCEAALKLSIASVIGAHDFIVYNDHIDHNDSLVTDGNLAHIGHI